MKYSQPARAASSRRDFSLSDAAISLLADPSARNPPFVRTRDRPPLRAEWPCRHAIDSGCLRQIPKRSCRPPCCLDAANAVLNHEGATWIYLHPLGCVEEEVGRRVAAFHHLRGIETRVEMRREAGQREREGHPVDIAGRGDTMRDLQVLQD